MNQKLLDRIRKLLRHERSAREIGNIHEAAAFAARIQEYVDRYNLNLSAIDIDEQAATFGVEDTTFRVREFWKQGIISSIATANGVIALQKIEIDRITGRRVRTGYVTLSGTAVDRAVVLELFDYFVELGKHLANAWRREVDAGRKHRGDFLAGYGHTLGNRILQKHEETIAASTADISPTDGRSTALVFVGNKLQLAREALEAVGKICDRESEPPPRKVNIAAFAAGQEAGNSVALTNKIMPHDNLHQPEYAGETKMYWNEQKGVREVSDDRYNYFTVRDGDSTLYLDDDGNEWTPLTNS